MTPACELLRDLVRIPSVNPAGDPGVSEPGEAEIASYLLDWLVEAGAETELREVLPGRPNVIARFPSDRPGKPRLLLAPHTDTVSVVGMTIDPFGGELRDGRIWGRGACDTKGSMAAMLSALESLGSDVSLLSHEIWFAGLMGEEAGLHGSRALAAQETFDFVIVGEPTDLKVVYSHKGSARWRMHAKGVAAHSATPEAGVNAIDLMVESLLWLKERFRALSVVDSLLGSPTLSVGTIHGGTKSNIVPDSCVVEIDMRIVPQFDASLLLREFRSKWPFIDVKETTAPPLATPRDHPLVGKLIGCGAAATVAPWFCDAAAFAERGVPGVAVGPGSIAQAHTSDEFLALDDLNRGTAFFAGFLHSLR